MNVIESKIEIACQQVLNNDSSVFSVQWVHIPLRHNGTLTPDFVLNRYFIFLRRFTLGMVIPKWTESGLEFRFLCTGLNLLAFSAPVRVDKDGLSSLTFHICGGRFVQRNRCDRGTFSFLTEKTENKIRVTVLLDNYHPRLLGSASPGRLRKYLYHYTQAHVHKLVTINFLAFLFRELEGKGSRCTVVAAAVRSGEDI